MDQISPPLGEEARATIAALVARMRDDDDERLRRWPEHPALRECARADASQGRLFVPAGYWFHAVSLDAEGRVVVGLDNANGAAVERLANLLEAHWVWQREVPRAWEELRAFVPSRPLDAVTCEVCSGTGRPPYAVGALAHVVCTCGNVGWIPAEALGLEAFADWTPADDSTNPAGQPERRPFWRRVVGWFVP